jgi:hypothetical protein
MDDDFTRLCGSEVENYYVEHVLEQWARGLGPRPDYAQLLEGYMSEYKRAIEPQVERLFEALRALPDEVAEVPFIGGSYHPHAPREEHVGWIYEVTDALCCRRWFAFEAPRWAQPLPLREKDCIALFNLPWPTQRLIHVGNYGMALRALGWRYWNAQPWERFCAPPPPEPEPEPRVRAIRRRRGGGCGLLLGP